MRRRAPTGPRGITSREWDVALLVARGLSNAEIGEELNIAEATVRTHLSYVFPKLGIRNRTELALYMVASGLVSVEDMATRLQAVANHSIRRLVLIRKENTGEFIVVREDEYASTGTRGSWLRFMAWLRNALAALRPVFLLAIVLTLLLSGCTVTRKSAFESPLPAPISPLPGPQPQLELTLTGGDNVILATVAGVGPDAPTWARVYLVYDSTDMAFEQCAPASAICTQMPNDIIEISGALPITARLLSNSYVGAATLRMVAPDNLLVANDGVATVCLWENGEPFFMRKITVLLLFVLSACSPINFTAWNNEYEIEGRIDLEVVQLTSTPIATEVPTTITPAPTATAIPPTATAPLASPTPETPTNTPLPPATISKFDLLDAANDTWLRLIADGDVLMIGEASNIAIGARVEGANVSGVRFELAGVTAVDTEIPYVFPGNTRHVDNRIDYQGMELGAGLHTLTATILDLIGEPGLVYTIVFEVVGDPEATSVVPTPTPVQTPMPTPTGTPDGTPVGGQATLYLRDGGMLIGDAPLSATARMLVPAGADVGMVSLSVWYNPENLTATGCHPWPRRLYTLRAATCNLVERGRVTLNARIDAPVERSPMDLLAIGFHPHAGIDILEPLTLTVDALLTQTGEPIPYTAGNGVVSALNY